MTLWSGRLSGKLDADMARLNASLPFDRRLASHDVRGSMAWARALARAGVLAPGEAEAILGGLAGILAEFERGDFAFAEGDEDIHTAVERRLAERIGPAAGKLHTGRSRNDQVATDLRLWVLDALEHVDGLVRDLQAVLVARAEQDAGIVLPGYTHLQRAQPVLLAHWWLAHFWPLEQDRARLRDLAGRTRLLPLGSGALAGTAFGIDRGELARDLGFDAACPNSLAGVADRDFAAEFVFCGTLIGLHLSRLAEALILFSTAEFGFVEMDEAFATGSSLMPQKKNPDGLELARAKSGKLIGLLTGLLATLKALPSAYDKDLQEDKPPVFESADILDLVLRVVRGVVATLAVRGERMRAAVDPQMLATDLADYLVERGVPFRAAHAATGQAVARAEICGVALPALPLAEYQAIERAFGPDLYQVFDVARALARRGAAGGTAPRAVQEQLRLAREALSRPHERSRDTPNGADLGWAGTPGT